MKIYTRTGDAGDTALFGGERVGKNDLRVAAIGAVDELNAVLGWSLTQLSDGVIRERVEGIQHDLFTVGADLATPPPRDGARQPETPVLSVERIRLMETWMDEADVDLPDLRAFVLPGGCTGAAALHVARTVCRRAERAVVSLAQEGQVSAGMISYLNRLSDLLFTFARRENQGAGRDDIEWRQPDRQ